MRILFQGDSITDCGRNYADSKNLGDGYPRYAAKRIQELFPEKNFEFLNRGIGGNRTEDLLARWQADCVDLQPEIVSILIGINDTWHHAEKRDWIPHEQFEHNYRAILTQIKERTNAKILILEQYLVDVPDKEFFRQDLDPKIDITRKLAREFADAYIPLDGLFAAETIHHDPLYWTLEGIHTTQAGAEFIAEQYARAVRPLIPAAQ